MQYFRAEIFQYTPQAYIKILCYLEVSDDCGISGTPSRVQCCTFCTRKKYLNWEQALFSFFYCSFCLTYCIYVYSDTTHITPMVHQCTHLMLCESSGEMTNTALNLNTHKLGWQKTAVCTDAPDVKTRGEPLLSFKELLLIQVHNPISSVHSPLTLTLSFHFSFWLMDQGDGLGTMQLRGRISTRTPGAYGKYQFPPLHQTNQTGSYY